MKVALVVLMLAALAAAKQVSVDAPPAKGDKIPPPPHHKVKRQACGTTPSTLNADQQKAAIAAHNQFRARESGASNMLKAVWSDKMAAMAQAWANTCTWAHGMLYDCDNNRLGQNLYVEGNAKPYNITGVVEAWWNEKSDYTFSTGACAPGKLCGHYTQLVGARSNAIGCAYNICPKMNVAGQTWTNCLFVVCDHTPAGNVIGDPVYLTGTACSDCDSDGTGTRTGAGYKCENNLCSPCTPASDATCKCGANPGCVNGAWSTSTCTCTCQKGYYGLKCDKACSCADASTDCADWEPYCTDPDYKDFMTENCMSTCKYPCNLPAACS